MWAVFACMRIAVLPTNGGVLSLENEQEFSKLACPAEAWGLPKK
jgi:hypothetical protein